MLKIKYNRTFLISFASLLLFVTLAWAFKTFYFVNELELSPHKKYILLSSAGFALIIISLFFQKKSGLGLSFALITYGVFTFILYADAVYERYYDSIIHIELMGQANQLDDVKDSILSLMYKTDFWYWIDLPLVFLIFLLFNRKEKINSTPLFNTTLFGCGASIILLLALLPLKPSYSDQYMVSLTGVIPTHIFNVTHSFYSKTLAKEAISQNSDEIQELKEKFQKNQEIQKASPYFGKYKGKNLIIVQAESLNTFPIGLDIDGEKVTPYIDSLINESHYYPNTFLQIGRGNTSDAEFVANNSIYPMAPKGIYKGYPQNDYRSLATILREQGYNTSATHGNSADFWNRQQAYKKQGYDFFYHKDHPMIKQDELIGLGISDESIFNQMVDIYTKKEGPFYNFIVTLTNHRPFEMPEEYQYMDLPTEFKGTPTGHYLQSVHYFDKALGMFIEDLKHEGLWDETIFVMYGDHYGPIPKDEEEIKELLGVTFDEKTRFKIPLVIHHPGQTEGVVNDVVSSQMDIYPTITSLMGVEQPLIQFGKPLDIQHEGFVGFAYETTKYTFYSDQYDYIASHDGSFESGRCIDNQTEKEVDLKACKKNYNKLVRDVETSAYLLENNLISNLFDDGKY